MSTDAMLSQRIKRYRKIRNITQEELAEEIGVTTNHIASIEAGRRQISLGTLVRVCECFHVSMAEMLPVNAADDSALRADWIAEIDDTLALLDTAQLGLVWKMVCGLRG